ncbi:MAG: SHOCT domain-containing protein [Clostridia bacterium]
MLRRGRVRPSKAQSVLGMIFGGAFILIGVMIVIPTFSWFGVLWTLGAVAITGFNAYNVFSQKGASFYEIDVETAGSEQSPGGDDFETKLRKIERLRQEGLLTQEEYQRKREEILREKW